MPKKSNPPSQPSPSIRGVDIPEIERILEFMQKHELEEFEYEREGFRVRLKKASTSVPVSYAPSYAPPPAAPEVPARGGRASHATPASGHPEAQSEAKPPQEDLHIVKSPIVGTFYTSASPESEPFVTVGAKVEPGQVLCIIEAMKLMNEIESDVAGEVVRVFVENGHPVEYGEQLFGIRAHRKK
jgi:acetyl-CoA carboxylase biotin carboxyl carrier protein